jgi:hypothetical protein
MIAHRKKFVTSGEIWTLYWLMLAAGFFWGAVWSYLAFLFFHFNREALFFLGMLTITTGVCAGMTTYVGSRRLLTRAHVRSRGSDLDLP